MVAIVGIIVLHSLLAKLFPRQASELVADALHLPKVDQSHGAVRLHEDVALGFGFRGFRV